jgi:hypothetical protein
MHGYAAIDTGTRSSAIDVGVMRALNIQPTGSQGWLGVTSKRSLNCPIFSASLYFLTSTNMEPLVLADFVGLHLEFGIDDPEIPGKPIIALLGRAALVNYLMIYDGPESSITLIRRQ